MRKREFTKEEIKLEKTKYNISKMSPNHEAGRTKIINAIFNSGIPNFNLKVAPL